MLSAAYDGIKARAPDAKVVLGGLMRPHEPGWLERVFATPGADAIHKFDIANIHLRGAVDAVVRRYGEFRAWLARRGFSGPLWVTEHGYPADPAFQDDPAYAGGDASQAAYLTQTLVGLGEVGAPQVFVTLRDQPGGEYATEGVEHIDETPATPCRAPPVVRGGGAGRRRLGPAHGLARRAARERARAARRGGEGGAVGERRADCPREVPRRPRARARRAGRARPPAALSAGEGAPVRAGSARARALLAGRRTALLLRGALANWHSQRADDHAAAVALLKREIAGG